MIHDFRVKHISKLRFPLIKLEKKWIITLSSSSGVWLVFFFQFFVLLVSFFIPSNLYFASISFSWLVFFFILLCLLFFFS